MIIEWFFEGFWLNLLGGVLIIIKGSNRWFLRFSYKSFVLYN